MTDTRQIEPSDFEGASLAQMRGWVEGGTAESLYNKTDGWKSEDAYLRELKTRLDDKLKEVGVVMQSESGEAMKNQAVPLSLWTEVAADSALAQSELMTQQGDAFRKVQTSIPGKGEEQGVPDDTWVEEGWDTLWTGSTDAEDAKAHNEKLRQEAVQAFQNYDSTSQSTVASNAVFTQPPGGGVDVAVVGGNHPTVGSGPTPSSTSSQSASGISGTGVGSSGIGSGVGAGSGSGGAGTTSMWHSPTQPSGGAERPPGPHRGPVPPGGPVGYPDPGGPGGHPGTGAGPGGRPGGGAGGAGRVGAGGRGAGGPGMGAGGRAGAGGLGSGAPGAGAGGAGGAGGRGGMAGAGAAGGRPQGKQGEEDQEHETPDYLVGDQGVFDEDLPRVAPPVFGDWEER